MKNYLTLLEELADEHEEAMGKLCDALPQNEKSKTLLADHFTDSRFESIRRRVLGTGNDGIREIQEQIDNLRIE